MIIGESCFNNFSKDLVIENYPNLQSIVIKKNSLENLNSLKICNCEKLKTIEVEDGYYDWDFEDYICTLSNVNEVNIESIY